MELKHTKGPWLLQKDYPTSVITAPGAPHAPSVAIVDVGPGNQEEIKANGHLIAAAPELLAALQSLYDLVAEEVADGEYTEQAIIALAAIAKATGKTA